MVNPSEKFKSGNPFDLFKPDDENKPQNAEERKAFDEAQGKHARRENPEFFDANVHPSARDVVQMGDTGTCPNGEVYDEDLERYRCLTLDELAGTAPPPPKKKKKSVKKRREKKKVDPLEAKVKRQTPQNYIALNLLTFAGFDGAPKCHTLKNLMLVTKYKGNLINKLTTSSKLAPLMCATPFELSQLTPTFRIFQKKAGKLQEFQFMDHVKWSYKLPGVGNDKERILNSSMGQGVGLKQFKWETTGTNLFSAPRTLTATLTLHFQSITELARSARIDEKDGVRWIDLIRPPMGLGSVIPQGCPTGIPPIDEVLQKTMTEQQLKEWNNTPASRKKMNRNFSLLVEVGWKYGINSTLSSKLRNAADRSLALLDLTMTSHNFKFREDGTIDVDVHYVARLDGLMDDYSANLFNLTSEGKNDKVYEELEVLKQQIQTMETSIDAETGVFACVEKGSLTKQQTNELDAKAEKVVAKIDKLEEEAGAKTKELALSIYGRFTEYLLDKDKLYFVDVPHYEYANGIIPKHLSQGPKHRRFQSAREHELLYGWEKDAGDPQADTLSTPTPDDVASLTVQKGDEEGTISGEKLRQQVQASWSAEEGLAENDVRVSFFYLGDLINFYAGVLPNENSATDIEKFEIVLGDLVFLDYKRIGNILEKDGFKSLEDKDLNDAQRSQMAKDRQTFLQDYRKEVVSNPSTYVVQKNMAHVPIAFDAYTTWFTDEIINGDSVWTFKSFIQSLTTRLVVGALQTADNAYVNADLRRALKEKTQIKAGVVTGRNKYLRRGRWNTDGATPQGESRLLVNRERSNLASYGVGDDDNVKDEVALYDSPEDEEFGIKSDAASEKGDRQFFILYVNRLPYASQKVDESRNAQEGIYHLKIGATGGLVKSINLTKEANQRIRDANIMRAYNSGGEGLGIIQEPYNATVKLFGAGFFMPGQYVYINPTNIGLGTQHERYSIARQLGIGGFYIITKVSTSVSEGKLETTLKCIFQNYGYLEAAPSSADEVKELRVTAVGDHEAGFDGNRLYGRHQEPRIEGGGG